MNTNRDSDTGRGHFALMPGTLAYVDAFRGGLVPCRVETVHGPGDLTVKVTADRPGWHRGELERVTDNDRRATVVPRTAVYVRSGSYRIAGGRVIAYPAPGAEYTTD